MTSGDLAINHTDICTPNTFSGWGHLTIIEIYRYTWCQRSVLTKGPRFIWDHLSRCMLNEPKQMLLSIFNCIVMHHHASNHMIYNWSILNIHRYLGCFQTQDSTFTSYQEVDTVLKICSTSPLWHIFSQPHLHHQMNWAKGVQYLGSWLREAEGNVISIHPNMKFFFIIYIIDCDNSWNSPNLS